MEIIYCEAPWESVASEVERIAKLHFSECDVSHGTFPFELDMEAMSNMNKGDMIHVTLAKNGDEIVGYIVNVVMPRHLNFKAKYAAHLGWYVAPEYRRQSVGMNLLKEAEKFLKEKGVAITFGSHTINLDASPLFDRLGWKKTETNYTKII